MKSSEIQNRLSENLKRIRKSKKITQEQLAERANVSPDTIKSLEQGRTWLSDSILSQITEALKVDVVHLFMPVADSFKDDTENKILLKKAIAKNIRNYIEEILGEYE
ncbi:MAG: helix-turn-helix domain-containing protein [Treponema sp.]|nr:helix-turn-helix domain-containing protein [Treponema sp.]